MIAPDIRVEDAGEGGFDRIVGVLARRDRGAAPEVHVLHESGRVLAAVHTVTGHLPGPHEDVVDPSVTAARWRDRLGVARVVVVDADQLGDVVALEPSLIGVDVPQPDLLSRLTTAFWSSPGVVADPPVEPARWSELAAWLRTLPDGVVTLVAHDGDEIVVALQSELRGGLLTTIEPLARVDAAPVVLSLDLAWPELEAILSAPDVAAALLNELAP